MELNSGGGHVCIETVYHKNLVLRGHSFMLVTKFNSVNLERTTLCYCIMAASIYALRYISKIEFRILVGWSRLSVRLYCVILLFVGCFYGFVDYVCFYITRY
jgi:hypothetical protein